MRRNRRPLTAAVAAHDGSDLCEIVLFRGPWLEPLPQTAMLGTLLPAR